MRHSLSLASQSSGLHLNSVLPALRTCLRSSPCAHTGRRSVWVALSLGVLVMVLGPGQAMAARPIGIDVSDYQSLNINWSTLKNTYGIVFAWAKISEGQSAAGGSHFATYAANAKAAGVLIGPYHYARYDLNTGTAGAIAEANYFWNRAKSYLTGGGYYIMPMLDVEASFSGYTKTTLSQWVNQWCTTVSNNAYAVGFRVKPCIYISSSHAASMLDSTVTKWNLDIANWYLNHSTAESQAQAASGPPAGIAPWTTWQFWQYDDQNVAQAVTTGDGDIFNGTLAQLQSTMVIAPVGPDITAQPANLTVAQGVNTSLSVGASGMGTLHYQWRFDGTNVAGATASRYALNNVQPADGGNYAVTVTDSRGSADSSLAYLSVVGPLVNGPGSTVVAPAGIVDWWAADGHAKDISGTVTCTPLGAFSYATGKTGLAFHFDGSTAYLTTAAADIPVPWTACMWVNRENAAGTSAALLHDGTYGLKLEQYNGTHQVGVTVLGVGDYVFSPAYTAPIGSWVHLAFVGTSTGTSLYVNGAFKASMTTSIPLPRAYIGAAYITSSAKTVDFLSGSLDEILLYNRALSPAEIQSIYSAGTPGLVRAPMLVNSYFSAPGRFALNLKGLTGKTLTIYYSTDLLNWSPIGSIPNPSGAIQYVDSLATTPIKFYRVSQP